MSKLKNSDTMIVNRILLGMISVIFWLAIIQWLFVRNGGETWRGLLLVVMFLLPIIPTLMLASYSMFIKISRGVITLDFEYEFKDAMKWAIVSLLMTVDFVFVIGGIGLIIIGYPWVGIGFFIAFAIVTLLIVMAARLALRKLLDPVYLRVDWDTGKTRQAFKASIMAFLEGALCSGLGATGIYFAFWPREYLIAGLFFAGMVIMLWHFRRTTQRITKDLGFPLKVEMRLSE